MKPANFDSVARIYQMLEFAAFGRLLSRVREAHLDHLRGCRDILLIGDGDGRALARLVAIAPEARVVSVDASRRMLDLAAQRIAAADRARVTFAHADARQLELTHASFDGVVTQWFFDCFTPAEVTLLVRRIAPALRPAGLWLFADFAIPRRGRGRVFGLVITSALYKFFRWRTRISASSLPPSEDEIENAGFVPIASASFAGGVLRSVVFKRSA